MSKAGIKFESERDEVDSEIDIAEEVSASDKEQKVEVDDKGREKIRVNIGDVRKTVDTTKMTDDQYSKFKEQTKKFFVGIVNFQRFLLTLEWKSKSIFLFK